MNALRVLYCVDEEGEERRVLSEKLFRAYWVEGRDVSDDGVLLKIAAESGVKARGGRELGRWCFADENARKELQIATGEAIERGAFGVPGFWLPQEKWMGADGQKRVGRFYWGQDRMHFLEASLLALKKGGAWKDVVNLKRLMPRCVHENQVKGEVKVEFWYDFSSPWAFLGWTQLARMKRAFEGNLEIVMKPFLLGILFRE